MRTGFHNLLRRLGVDLVRYPGRAQRFPAAERQRLLRALSVDLILDVGANTGQFAQRMRRDGFAGRIVSFEPLAAPFEALSRSAATDPLWEVHHLAVGADPGATDMHVTSDSWSSSMLSPLDAHKRAANFSVVDRVTVRVATLDGLAEHSDWRDHVIYLKADVQGAELDVIRGAKNLLSEEVVSAIEVEVSLAQLYEGQPSFSDVQDFMSEHGYVLVRIEPEYHEQTTGALLQINATYKAARPPKAA